MSVWRINLTLKRECVGDGERLELLVKAKLSLSRWIKSNFSIPDTNISHHWDSAGVKKCWSRSSWCVYMIWQAQFTGLGSESQGSRLRSASHSRRPWPSPSTSLSLSVLIGNMEMRLNNLRGPFQLKHCIAIWHLSPPKFKILCKLIYAKHKPRHLH